MWQGLDTAPKDKKVLLFLPWTDSPDGTGKHPDAKPNHGRVVGWWDEDIKGWVTALPGQKIAQQVYPSRWTDLPDEPTKI